LTHSIAPGAFAPAIVPAVPVAIICTGLAIVIGSVDGRNVFARTPISAPRPE
jgi:hypothetical protein